MKIINPNAGDILVSKYDYNYNYYDFGIHLVLGTSNMSKSILYKSSKGEYSKYGITWMQSGEYCKIEDLKNEEFLKEHKNEVQNLINRFVEQCTDRNAINKYIKTLRKQKLAHL